MWWRSDGESCDGERGERKRRREEEREIAHPLRGMHTAKLSRSIKILIGDIEISVNRLSKKLKFPIRILLLSMRAALCIGEQWQTDHPVVDDPPRS